MRLPDKCKFYREKERERGGGVGRGRAAGDDDSDAHCIRKQLEFS